MKQIDDLFSFSRNREGIAGLFRKVFKVRGLYRQIGMHLEGCIYELNFGYNAKTVVYTNSSSDIPKLYEMLCLRKTKRMGEKTLKLKRCLT